MVWEYLKMIRRRILRQKIYAVINVMGLTIAFTAFLLIYMHVVKEWKTDHFHQDADRIYRVTIKSTYRQNWISLTTGPMAPYAKAEFPGIEEYTRVYMTSFDVKKKGEQDFIRRKNCVLADKQFFKLFTFPLISGDIKQDWGKDWVVITEREARKYFGSENPLGKTIEMKVSQDPEGEIKEFRVVAVMKNFPASSSLQGDYVMDLTSEKDLEFWGMYGFYTYFKLKKNADVAIIEKGIPELIHRNYAYIEVGEEQYKLQPLQEVYLGSDHIPNDLPHGSGRMNAILATVALLILLLAGGNYLMIAMAQLHTQAGGIVMQRCLGADNRYLFWRVFWEIIVYAGIALGISGVLVVLLHLEFIAILTPGRSYALSVTLGEIGLFLAIIIGFMCGIGFILTGWIRRHVNQHSVREILQRHAGRMDPKVILSVVQMCIFSGLLGCSVILTRQMNFIKERQLGFDTHNVLNFSWRFGHEIDLESERIYLKNTDPDILTCSNGVALPILGGRPEDLSPEDQPDKKITAYLIHGDAHYLPTYQIQLVDGRNIRPESYPRIRDEFMLVREGNRPEILVNEEFVRQWGKKDILGSTVSIGEDGFRVCQVVGVVKDFHFMPLYEKVKPMFIAYDMPFISYSVLVRYREGCRQKVIGHLQKMYEEKFPNTEFSYTEYEFSQFYDKDMALARMIYIFTVIAIFVGGMGIFAFSMFMAEKRRKEVALRKINGAGVWQIILLLNRQFLLRTLLACVIGLPIAHYAMTRWLMGFAYKAQVTVGLYLGIVGICLIFVIVIITWQVCRAAQINPVDILKDE